MEILSTLQTLYPTFTKTERKIADFLLADPENNYYPGATLEEFSTQMGVGQASLVRLIKKCGYSSYRNFMVDLSNAQYQSLVSARMASRRRGDSLYDDLALQMTRCRDNLGQEDMRQVAELLRRADLILCAGFGDSSHIAAIAASRLRRENLLAVQDVSGEVSLLSRRYGRQPIRTLVFAFSVTGETYETVQAVKLYKNSDAQVAVFTGYMESTLAKLADFTFFTPSKAPRRGRRDIDGIFTQLYTLESIMEEYLSLLSSSPEV